jgi:hypothetical protein
VFHVKCLLNTRQCYSCHNVFHVVSTEHSAVLQLSQRVSKSKSLRGSILTNSLQKFPRTNTWIRFTL